MCDSCDDEQGETERLLDRRSILKYGGGSAATAGLAGCQSPQNPVPGSGLRVQEENDDSGQANTEGDKPLSGETLKIGILAPMQRPLGQSMWDAARLHRDQINENGGILGAKVEVELGDTEVSPGEAASQHRRLIRRANCDLTMGIFLGSALLQTMPSIANEETIHITTASADPRIGRLVSKTDGSITGDGGEAEYERFKYHFRAGPINLFDLADAMAEFIEDKKEDYGWERVAMLTENPNEFTPYVERLSENLEGLIEVPFQARVGGVADWSPIYNEIESKNCDIALVGLALIGTSAVNQWTAQERSFEFGGIHVDAQTFGFWGDTGGNVEYVWTMNAMTPQTENTPLTQQFVNEYMERFDRVPVYSGAITYDAFTLVEQTLGKVVKEEGLERIPDDETIIPYMEEMTYSGSTIMEGFQFTPPDAEFAHEPKWTSIAETGVPVFQQWQDDPEVREKYGTMHSFYPPQNKTAEYQVPDWIGGG